MSAYMTPCLVVGQGDQPRPKTESLSEVRQTRPPGYQVASRLFILQRAMRQQDMKPMMMIIMGAIPRIKSGAICHKKLKTCGSIFHAP